MGPIGSPPVTSASIRLVQRFTANTLSKLDQLVRTPDTAGMRDIETGKLYELAGRVLAAIAGAIVWGGLFSILGLLGDRGLLGTLCGVTIGSVIGLGLTTGELGPVVPWMSVFAFIGAILGPACDADALSSALSGAAIGAFIGAAGMRGLLALIGCLIGVNVGVQSGDVGAWLGLLLGAGIGWIVGHLLALLGH
jgi:hypothetical protein